MKHTAKITLVLLAIFLFSQYFGLAVVHQYIDTAASAESGEVVFEDLPLIERPDVNEDVSYLWVGVVILLGTGLLLLLIKLKAFVLWRFWFFFAVLVTATVSLGAFMHTIVAVLLGLILAMWKTFRGNPIIHNVTEPLIYAGLAAIFVPIFSLTSIIILLVLISLYDMYAVWQSKHMITLAKAQSEAKVFAGLSIPYTLKGKILTKRQSTKKPSKDTKTKRPVPKPKTTQVRSAILGGGDIGFPLFFAGVIFKEFGLLPALIIPLFATAGLALLFYYSKEKRFYPAMPPITLACLLGLGFVWMIGLLG